MHRVLYFLYCLKYRLNVLEIIYKASAWLLQLSHFSNCVTQWCPTFFPLGLDGWCSVCLCTRSHWTAQSGTWGEEAGPNLAMLGVRSSSAPTGPCKRKGHGLAPVQLPRGKEVWPGPKQPGSGGREGIWDPIQPWGERGYGTAPMQPSRGEGWREGDMAQPHRVC